MRAFHSVALAAAAMLSGACASPRSQAYVASALNDAATEISGLRGDLAQLQTEIDSLRTRVAKQDTTIAHLADVAHVPVTR